MQNKFIYFYWGYSNYVGFGYDKQKKYLQKANVFPMGLIRYSYEISR